MSLINNNNNNMNDFEFCPIIEEPTEVVEENRIEYINVCPTFLKSGSCRFGARCTSKNGVKQHHFNERDKNMNNNIKDCQKFLSSPYEHDPLICLSNGGCNSCKFGNCSFQNECNFRHDATFRNKIYNENIINNHIICTYWKRNFQCNNRNCKLVHLNQCPVERENYRCTDLNCNKIHKMNFSPRGNNDLLSLLRNEKKENIMELGMVKLNELFPALKQIMRLFRYFKELSIFNNQSTENEIILQNTLLLLKSYFQKYYSDEEINTIMNRPLSPNSLIKTITNTINESVEQSSLTIDTNLQNTNIEYNSRGEYIGEFINLNKNIKLIDSNNKYPINVSKKLVSPRKTKIEKTIDEDGFITISKKKVIEISKENTIITETTTEINKDNETKRITQTEKVYNNKKVEKIINNQKGEINNQKGDIDNQKGKIINNQKGEINNQKGEINNQKGEINNQKGEINNQKGKKVKK